MKFSQVLCKNMDIFQEMYRKFNMSDTDYHIRAQQLYPKSNLNYI